MEKPPSLTVPVALPLSWSPAENPETTLQAMRALSKHIQALAWEISFERALAHWPEDLTRFGVVFLQGRLSFDVEMEYHQVPRLQSMESEASPPRNPTVGLLQEQNLLQAYIDKKYGPFFRDWEKALVEAEVSEGWFNEVAERATELARGGMCLKEAFVSAGQRKTEELVGPQRKAWRLEQVFPETQVSKRGGGPRL